MADKKDAAKAFHRAAVLLELSGENEFKVRAYQRAARLIEAFEGGVGELRAAAAKGAIRGLGAALGGQLTEYLDTGRMSFAEEIEASLPAGLTTLLAIPGVGAKTARRLHLELGIASLDELETAARDGRLTALGGFGAKKQSAILAGIARVRTYEGLFHLQVATREAAREAAFLAPHATRVEIAGAVRRRMEVVDAIDLVACAKDIDAAARAFTEREGVSNVALPDPAIHSVRLPSGMICRVRLVPENAFFAALVHDTGSAAHVDELRRRAESLGLSLDARGVARGLSMLPCPDEAAVYKHLDLAFVPPELREGLGEIDQAAAGTLPALVTRGDLRGVLHMHTQYSDGTASVRAMAEASQAMGYRYAGICDHSKSSTVAGGMSIDEVKRQHAEIDGLNARFTDFRVLKGIECDILRDGSLDYPDDVLETFDFVIASVHAGFQMTREQMTARVLAAIASPFVTILGHPTGRLLLSREPYEIDIDEMLAACEKYGAAIEINANPHRLDLDWRHVRRAIAAGIRVSIGPDAHSEAQLAFDAFGIDMARKAGCGKADVLNALDAEAFCAFARGRRDRS